MVTDGLHGAGTWSRRGLLAATAGLAWPLAVRGAGPAPHGGAGLLAAWQNLAPQGLGMVQAPQGTETVQAPQGLGAVQAPAQAFHELGLLSARPGAAQVLARLALPSRPHGLCVEPGGTVLAVARRPGDWLLRWRPGQTQAQWHWQDDDRRLNGHVVALGTQQLLTTETDRDTGQGWLGLRARHSLHTLDAWPTHGPDPHQLLVLPQAVGRWPAGTVLVANGGITQLPETGRSARQPGPLDASLVALHPTQGSLLGQWRLPDAWLSIRHLAWNASTRQVGVALQAEHPEAQARRAAPVLAVWNGQALQAARGQPDLAGYGGDIVAMPGGGYAVSCPRADGLALFSADGVFMGVHNVPAVCALARAHAVRAAGRGQGHGEGQGPGIWAAASSQLVFCSGDAEAPEPAAAEAGQPGTASTATAATASTAAPAEPAAWQLDNHWQVWPASA